MQVQGGLFQFAMTQQNSNRSQIGAVFKQVCSKTLMRLAETLSDAIKAKLREVRIALDPLKTA